MRLSVIATAVCLSLGSASVALAQPKALFRPVGKPDGRGNNDDKDKDRDGRMCSARRNILNNEQKRYESQQSEVAGLESEIASLQRRVDELKRQRDESKRTLATLEKRYKKADDSYKKECSTDTNACTAFDVEAADLSRRSDEVERDLDVVRTEIRDNKTEIGRLETRIAPLQKEYGEKSCNNLIPGETEQSVIDRCSAIFSDWNRLQADLNRSNNRVPTLRSRYESLLAELKNLEKRASTYESYLAKNCTESKETAKMRGFGARRERAQTIGQELDALVNDITKLRGVKITVSAQ